MRGKARIPAAALAALAVTVAACGGSEGPSAPIVPTPPAPKPLTREQVIARAKNSVAQLVSKSEWGGTQWGTLTMIGPHTGVTNAHVVEGGSQLRANFGAKGSSAAVVVGVNTCRDLALVNVKNVPAGVGFMPFADPSSIQTGMDVTAAGYPRSSGLGSRAFATITTGSVSADALQNVNLGSDIAQQPSMMSTTAAISPGNSGGPAFNDKGQIVGLNTYSLTSEDATYYAIRVDAIKQALPDLQNGQKGFGLSLTPVRMLHIYSLLRYVYDNVNPQWARVAAAMVKADAGMMITGVAPGSEADRRHLQVGEVITDMNNVAVHSATGACRTYDNLAKGDTLKLQGYHLLDASLRASFDKRFTFRLHSKG